MSHTRIEWLQEVDDDDFAAGESYLRLLYPAARAKALTSALKRAPIVTFAAKDILRASELTVLSRKEPDVAKQLRQLRKGSKFSPLLLVRETGHARLIVADGFHRLCAVMHLDPDERVPCKIA